MPSSWRASWQNTWEAASGLLWPRECLSCQQLVEPSAAVCLCQRCVSSALAPLLPYCHRCGSTIGLYSSPAGCLNCRNESYNFATVTRLGVYDGLLREWILRCKNTSEATLAEVLGQLFGHREQERLLACQPEVIVPVPLHWKRYWGRKHNQAAGIASGLGQILGIPVRSAALKRIHDTPRQTFVTPAQRRTNLLGAFRVSQARQVQNKRVLLVDDVLTTGATANAAATAIRTVGAAQVDVAVLAHR